MTPAAIAALVDRLTKARDAYYNGIPIMSDAAFDVLEDELRAADPTNAFFSKVGSPVNGAWPTVRHTIPMMSLNKANEIAEIASWRSGCGVVKQVTISDKLDGMSLGLKFEKKALVQGVTRGDGAEGADITRNVKLMQGVLKMLPPVIAGRNTDSVTVHVRGEVIVTKTDFKKYFPGESNPRNTAAGTAKRQSDFGLCARETFIAYQLLIDGQPLASKSAEFTTLKAMGFFVPHWSVANTVAEIETVYKKYIAGVRADLDYDIDGLVIEVDDSKQREDLGDTNGRPKGGVAFKFPHEAKQTILRAIRWQVGNSGRITPVAEFDTVNLGGANVSQASLHNIDNIEELVKAGSQAIGLGAGDKILVSRRNDVIPYVEELLTTSNTKPFTTPTECPSCKAATSRDGVYLVCTNMDCDAQTAGGIKRWVAKVGILNLGESMITAMVEAGMVKDCADLYTVDPLDVSSLDTGGRVIGGSADKAFKNLRAKMTLPLHVIVGSVGIKNCGRSIAKTIIDGGFNTLSKMMKASVADLTPVIGPSKAEDFILGFQGTPQNGFTDGKAGLIAKLIGNGIQVQTVSGALLGQSFCLTGFRDPALQDAIEKIGGTLKSSVSRDLTYLIASDPTSTSGKAQKARQYGTKVIGIEDAWTMVGGR